MSGTIKIYAVIEVKLDDLQPHVWVPLDKHDVAVGCVVETPNGGFFSADYGPMENPAQYVRTLFVDRCQFDVHVTDVEGLFGILERADPMPIPDSRNP